MNRRPFNMSDVLAAAALMGYLPKRTAPPEPRPEWVQERLQAQAEAKRARRRARNAPEATVLAFKPREETAS